MKKCSKCKVEKELNNFTKQKKNKDGLKSVCKDCTKEYAREYYKSNIESLKQCKKEYYQANREQRKEQRKEYYKANKQQIKEYYQANKEKINNKTAEYNKIKRLKNPLFKMTHNLRSRTYQAFKTKGYNKNTKTQEMLGVNWLVCKAHIERQFTKGMSWDNSGDWHIDHIIPLASANTEEELKKLCHYSNLQPLWAVDNLIKSNVINGQQNKFRF